MAEIDKLKICIEKLESENAYLKTLLEQAGIEYKPIDAISPSSNALFDPNQDSRIIPEKITHNHARLFYSYFWGRTDVYSKRSQNKTTGKAGYYCSREGEPSFAMRSFPFPKTQPLLATPQGLCP